MWGEEGGEFPTDYSQQFSYMINDFFSFYIWEFHLPLEFQLEVNFGKKCSNFFLNSSTSTTFIAAIIGLPMHYKFKYTEQFLWVCVTAKTRQNETICFFEVVIFYKKYMGFFLYFTRSSLYRGVLFHYQSQKYKYKKKSKFCVIIFSLLT